MGMNMGGQKEVGQSDAYKENEGRKQENNGIG